MKDLNDPTNVDSVPAMLTPGEFVLNKEASQMFASQLEQMNQAGLQQRDVENKNMGGMIPHYNEGGSLPTLPTAYNTGGLVGFLKEQEGYRDKAYKDSGGVYTIGYGRTKNPDGSPVREGQSTQQADEDSWLDQRAGEDRSATEAFGKKHGYNWNPQQTDALSSFRYNVGNLDQLTKGGTRSMEEIQNYLPQYNKAGGEEIDGLSNRRGAELALFNSQGQAPTQEVPTQEAPPSAVDGIKGFGKDLLSSAGGVEGLTTAGLGALIGEEQQPLQHLQGRRIDAGPEFISLTGRNDGGPIPMQHLNIGGALKSLFGGGADAIAKKNLRGTLDEKKNDWIPFNQGQAEEDILTFGKSQRALGRQPQQQVVPQSDGTAPPKPFSDEALQQDSSQAVEAQEDNALAQYKAQEQAYAAEKMRGRELRAGGTDLSEGDVALLEAEEADRQQQKQMAKWQQEDAADFAQTRGFLDQSTRQPPPQDGVPHLPAGAQDANQVAGFLNQPGEIPVPYDPTQDNLARQDQADYNQTAGFVNQGDSGYQAGLEGVPHLPAAYQDANQVAGFLGQGDSGYQAGLEGVPHLPAGAQDANQIAGLLDQPTEAQQQNYGPEGFQNQIVPQQNYESSLSQNQIDPVLAQAAGTPTAGYDPQVDVNDPARIAGIESGEIEPTDADFAAEEERYRLDEALRQNRLDQSVAAHDADGRAFLQQQEKSIVQAMNDVGNPGRPTGPLPGSVPLPEGEGVPGEGSYAEVTAAELAGVGGKDVVSDLPSAKATATETLEVANKKRKATDMIRDADSQATKAREGLASATSEAEIEKFSRMAENADKNKTAGEAQIAEALVQEEEFDAKSAIAEAQKTANKERAGAQLEAAREAAQSRAGFPTATPEQAATSIDEVVNTPEAAAETSSTPSPHTGQGSNPGEGVGTDETKEAGEKATPEAKKSGFDAVKKAFGSLLDNKELVRMGVLFAGSLAVGATPAQALQFAGKNYIERVDAKASNQAKRIDGLVKGGKYNAASIKSYSDSGDPTDLIPVGATPERTGKFKTLYGPKGAVKVEEVKFGDTVKQVDSSGNIISEFGYKDDAASVSYTPEGREAQQKESKEYAGIFKEAQDVVIEANKGGDYPGPNTGLLPKASGNDAAKWARANGVPPAGMGQLLRNAFDSAQRDGKKAKSIVPYLNEQYIQTNVGDKTHFQLGDGTAVEAQKTNQWLSTMKNTLKQSNPAAFNNKSGIEISQFVLGSQANKDWASLDTETKADYTKQGKSKGYSGWMAYMDKQIQP